MSQQTDTSRVPLQGGYIAKECPVVIQNRLTVPEAEVRDPAPDALMRMEAGIQFEAELVARLAVQAGDSWLLVPQELDREAAQDLTRSAMEAEVPVIHNGFLEPDRVGRRTGRPDLLVYHRGGYLPVDIKHRITLDAGTGGAGVSDPLTPEPDMMETLEGWVRRPNKDDALQLAHYRRILQALGRHSESTLAGIIGKEETIVWYDLEEPMWITPSTSDPSRKTKKRSTMEVYDFEFGWRLKIAAAALSFREGSGEGLLVEPMWCGDCPGCGFANYCLETLDRGSGDASRLPGNTYPQWRRLRDNGIRERAEVATLHYPTAALSKSGVEVGFFLDAAVGLPDDTPVAQLRPKATKQNTELARAGIRTVGDLGSLDPLTARFGGSIANQILEARAAVGDAPVYRRPGANGPIHRADVEIDLDMENMNEGVYLWGALLTDRTGTGVFHEGYRDFTTWEPLDDRSEQVPFQDLLEWLRDQEDLARSRELSFAVFVWHESAENTQLRRIARRAGTAIEESVERMIGSDSWVDLKKVFDAGWITGGSSSLKTIAPLSGHSWEVDDPGGGVAMARYSEAVITDSDEARTWLLEYNRGDVEATRSIREWLTREGHLWPEVGTH